jgi:hypothetical protein
MPPPAIRVLCSFIPRMNPPLISSLPFVSTDTGHEHNSSPTSPASPASPLSIDLLGTIMAGYRRPRRQSTASSRRSTASAVSSSSAHLSFTTSSSSRRTRSLSISDITRVDLFRMHSIRKDLTAAFPSPRQLVCGIGTGRNTIRSRGLWLVTSCGRILLRSMRTSGCQSRVRYPGDGAKLIPNFAYSWVSALHFYVSVYLSLRYLPSDMTCAGSDLP